MLKIKNLCYKYDFYTDSKYVINDISFELNDNEILVLTGASGSGKSTLVKLLSGLLTPQSGNVLLDDISIYKIKNLYSKIGVTLQNPENQLFCRTMHEELAFSLKNLKYDSNKTNSIISEFCEFWEISNKILSDSPYALSLGNKRICAIACAAILKPKILILDEPTSGLDYKNRTKLINFIKMYKQKCECSIVIATHDIELIAEISDQMIILQNGTKIAHDTPKNIFLKYENLNPFGLQKPQISEIVQLVNMDKKYLNYGTFTINDVIRQITRKTNFKRG